VDADKSVQSTADDVDGHTVPERRASQTFAISMATPEKHSVPVVDRAALERQSSHTFTIMTPEKMQVGILGPAWTQGAMEKPLGSWDMGGWFAAVYTEEQQERLQLDAFGSSTAILEFVDAELELSMLALGSISVALSEGAKSPSPDLELGDGSLRCDRHACCKGKPACII
jgi:hypothetical protein